MIELKAVTRDNWEEAMALTYGDDTFVSVSEVLAAAYISLGMRHWIHTSLN